MRTLQILISLFLCFSLSLTTYGQQNSSTKEIVVKEKNSAVKNDTIKKVVKDSFLIPKKELENKNDVRIYIKENEQKTNIFKDILPILTLLLGILINRGIDYLTDRRKIKKNGERWKAELSSLELPIKKQIDFLEAFLIEHNKEKFEIPKLVISQSLNCESFGPLDKTELIKYFEKFKGKNYSNSVSASNQINSFVGILKYHYESLKKKFEEYLSGTSNHTSILNTNLQLLMKSFAEYGVLLETEINGDPLNDPRYRPILDLFESEIRPYMESGNYDVFILESRFFKPLIQTLSHLRMDERINPMVNYTQNCINSIKGIKMEKKYLSVNISTLIEYYKEDEKELVAVLKTLK